MKFTDVVIVRIYVTESSNLHTIILNYLKKDAAIRGVSVFRAISGFGDHGNHGVALIDFSLNLPLTIEFFDTQEKIQVALEHLKKIVEPEHIIFWEAKAMPEK